MTDFGLGDKAVYEGEILRQLDWHGLNKKEKDLSKKESLCGQTADSESTVKNKDLGQTEPNKD